MASIHFDITGNSDNLKRALQEARGGIRDMVSSVEQSGSSIESMFANIGKFAGAYMTFDMAKNFAKQVATTRGEFQQLEVAFSTMLGSAEKSNDLMQQLVKTAAITPFDLKGVAQGAKQLLAYGIAAEDINDTLVHLGDIAAGLSIPLGDLVYLYGTTMAQGRMFTQDMRQFMGRGIPLTRVLAEQLGVAESAIGDMVTKGQITADIFHKAIMSMSSDGGQFAGLMEAQSKTISGQISNIEDSIDVMFNEIGKNSEGAINDVLSVGSSLVEHYKEVGTVLASLIASYGMYKASLIATAAVNKAIMRNDFSSEVTALNDEIAKLQSALPVKQANKNADLEEMVAKGKLTQAQSDLIAKRREEVEAIRAEAAARTNDLDEAVTKGQITEEERNLTLARYEDLAALKEQMTQEELAQMSKVENLQNTANLEQKYLEDLQNEAIVMDASVQKATERLNVADQNLAKAEEYLNLAREAEDIEPYQLEAAQADYDTAEIEQAIAAKELLVAQQEQEVIASELESQANIAEAASEAAATAQTELHAIAEAQDSTAVTANTTATTANTGSLTLNTIASKASAIAHGVLSVAINGVKNAWNAMKVAMMTNPIGAILGVVSLAIGLFSAFGKKESEVSKSTQAFTQSVADATSRLEFLQKLINSTGSETSVYKKALDELDGITKEYGITIDKEKDSREVLNKKIAETIELKKQEANATALANGVGNAYQNYQSRREGILETAQDEIGDSSMNQKVLRETIATVFENEAALNSLSSAYDKVNKNIKDYGGNSREAYQASKEYNAELHKFITDYVNQQTKALNLNKREQLDLYAVVQKVATSEAESISTRKQVIDSLHQQSVASAMAKAGIEDYSTALDKGSWYAQVLAQDTDTAAIILSSLINDFDGREIRMYLALDTSQIPSWAMDKTMEDNLQTMLYFQEKAKKGPLTKAERESFGANAAAYNAKKNGTQVVRNRRKPASVTPSTNRKTRKSGSGGSKPTQAEIDQQVKDLTDDYNEALNEFVESLNEEFNSAATEMLEDGIDKDLIKLEEQAEADVKALKESIKEQADSLREFEYNKWQAVNHDKKKHQWDKVNKDDKYWIDEVLKNNPKLKSAYEQREKQIDEIKKLGVKRRKKQERDAQQEALNNYLKDYGDYEEKRQALASQYARDMEKATTEGDRKAAAAKYREALESLDFEQLKKKIRWEDIFGDIDSTPTERLKDALTELRKRLQDTKLSAEDYKTTVEAINKIQVRLDNDKFINNFIPDFVKVRNRLKNEMDEIGRILSEKEAEYADVFWKTGNAKNSFLNAIYKIIGNDEGFSNWTFKEGETTLENVLSVVDRIGGEKVEENKEKVRELYNEWNRLRELLKSLGIEIDDTEKDFESAREKWNNAPKTFWENFKKKFNEDPLGLINSQMQALSQSFHNLGIEGKGVEALDKLAASTQFAENALKSFISGDLLGAVSNVIGMFKSQFDALDSLFGADYSRYDEMKEKYTKILDIWDELIDKKTEYISISYGQEARNAYDDANKALQTQIDLTKALARERLRSGSGWGSHSQNVRMYSGSYKSIDNQTWSDVAAEITARTGKRFSSMYDLLDFTAEDLRWIKENYTNLWAAMDEDTRGYFDKLIEYGEAGEDMIESLQERITGTTFDSFLDDFLSKVSDMESTFEDMTGDFEKQLREAILKAIMADKYKSRIQALYDSWVKAYEDDNEITPEEAAELKKKNSDLVKEMIDERDALNEAFGWDNDVDLKESASSGKFSSITESQASYIEGRLTAIQISGERRNEITQAILNTIQENFAVSGENNTYISEIRNMMVMTNSYLEDVARYARLTYAEFGDKIDRLVTNTNNL